MNSSRVARAFSLTQAAHQWLALRELPDGLLVDMTVGAGHDTCFLAKSFPGRPLLAIDIQPAALELAKQALGSLAEGLIHWRCGCHSRLEEWMGELGAGAPSVALAMYNLGYLPGSDKSVITLAETTLASLRVLQKQMVVGGIISLMVYTGHAGGEREKKAIDQELVSWPFQEWSIWEMARPYPQGSSPAPRWLMIQRLK